MYCKPGRESGLSLFYRPNIKEYSVIISQMDNIYYFRRMSVSNILVNL